MDTSNFLPPIDRQERLVGGLANLIGRRGFETFVLRPILEPTNVFFPDQWAPTVRGVRVLAQRILAYAGLEHLGVSMQTSDDPPEASSTAAWFAGIVDGTCRFGLNVRVMDDCERMTAALCHEVAHAYREHHDLVTSREDIEEALTDLTTIYLGFGIFTVNATYQYVSGRLPGGGGSFWKERTLGYLSPIEMSYLFALQTLARQASDDEATKWARLLGPEQKALFFKCRAHLKDGAFWQAELALPVRQDWPAPPTLDEVVIELPELPEEESDAIPLDRPAPPPYESHRTIYRVRPPLIAAISNGLFFSLVAILAGLFITAIIGDIRSLDSRLVAFLLAGFAAGFFWARLRWDDRCSNPQCKSRIARRLDRCPTCGGQIVGLVIGAPEPAQALKDEEPFEEPEEPPKKRR